ncbi:MAG: hypothetical protein ACK41T_00945 [Pseudobdellovibrio sp.]
MKLKVVVIGILFFHQNFSNTWASDFQKYEFQIKRISHIGSIRFDTIKFDQKFYLNNMALSDKLYLKFQKKIEGIVEFLQGNLVSTSCEAGEVIISDMVSRKIKRTCAEGDDYVDLVVTLEEIKDEM